MDADKFRLLNKIFAFVELQKKYKIHLLTKKQMVFFSAYLYDMRFQTENLRQCSQPKNMSQYSNELFYEWNEVIFKRLFGIPIEEENDDTPLS